MSQHESDNLVRISTEIKKSFGLEDQHNSSPKDVGKALKKCIKENHKKTWISKPQHGYLYRSYGTIPNIDKGYQHRWLSKSNFSSHVEGYIFAIQEEEIYTNLLKSKRQPNLGTNPQCRLCRNTSENIQHVLASCPRLSTSFYLPFRHNTVAKYIYMKLANLDDPLFGIPEVYTNNQLEIWWDSKIKTTPKVAHDRPDIILWNRTHKQCFIIDICVGLDINIPKNIKQKEDNYLPLAASLKELYPLYTFEVIPLVLGATGLVTKEFRVNLNKLGLCESIISNVIEKCQLLSLKGSVSIVKSFVKM